MSEPAVPTRFAHLLAPPTLKDYVVLAETTSLRDLRMHGMRSLTTGLVPKNRLKRVIEGPGRQGWLRREFSDPPMYRKGTLLHRPFDLVTAGGLVVEALVEGWTNHNLIVALPQQQILATYGLRPRMIESDESVRWDDPEHATYDVL